MITIINFEYIFWYTFLLLIHVQEKVHFILFWSQGLVTFYLQVIL